MARIVVTGGAGFLGQRVLKALLRQPTVDINGEARPLDELVVLDRVVPAQLLADPRVRALEGDLGIVLETSPEVFQGADAVIHLASAVSGECEADLQLGLTVNLQTGIRLGEVLAMGPGCPLLVFASSLAIYGGCETSPLPDVITDTVRPTPQNSYGAQKLMLETLFADLDRRGLIDARTLRLMTVSVRPGRPNQAASGFLSGIIREPLAGEPAVVPVDPTLEVALNSPDGAVAGLIHALAIDRHTWGGPLGVNLPGLRLTVAEMIQALEVVAGPEAVARLVYQMDARIDAIVSRWPAHFHSARASQIGFTAESEFTDVIRRFQQQQSA
mgnify:CR=1 FL=1